MTSGDIGNTNATVKAAMDAEISGGAAIGLQVAAYKDGKIVLDVWAGSAGKADGRRKHKWPSHGDGGARELIAADAQHVRSAASPAVPLNRVERFI